MEKGNRNVFVAAVLGILMLTAMFAASAFTDRASLKTKTEYLCLSGGPDGGYSWKNLKNNEWVEKTFTDIVKESAAPPSPEESPAQQPAAQQAPIQKYLHKSTRKIREGMPEIYLPETESAAAPAPPPAPGVAMPKLEEGDTKTKFLPEGEKDLMKTINGIVGEAITSDASPPPPDDTREDREELGATKESPLTVPKDAPRLPKPSEAGETEKERTISGEVDLPPPPE